MRKGENKVAFGSVKVAYFHRAKGDKCRSLQELASTYFRDFCRFLAARQICPSKSHFFSRTLIAGESMSLSTPVVFIIFNRADVTQRVFERIAQAKPAQLLVIADGPRSDRIGEAEKVAATRKIIESVDWPCEVMKNYSDQNLGCKQRVASGLNWVFSMFEQAIILEDDCLPDPTFFLFCERLLYRFRDDTRVSNIAGTNFQFGRNRMPESYYFSKYFHCWGWASWRRVWDRLDLELATWPEFHQSDLLDQFADSSAEKTYWQSIFDSQYSGEISSWAYPWLYSSWTQAGLTVLPSVNLISNIGFEANATHTKATDDRLANIPTQAISTLTHPATVARNKPADQFTFENVFQSPLATRRPSDKFSKRIKRRLRFWKKTA